LKKISEESFTLENIVYRVPLPVNPDGNLPQLFYFT
jgi:hypothetical protein